jgi:hypothetical protein
MDIFRLTYFVASSEVESKWESERRFETFGSREAICDLWFHLNQLKELKEKGIHPCASPMFIEVFNVAGDKQDMSKGLFGMVGSNTFR